MNWCETIHLRIAGAMGEELMRNLIQLVEDIRKKEDCQRVILYRHAQIENDVCIHLLHDPEKSDFLGSSLGLRLTETLKDYGMTSHDVWMDVA